jgi:hypothetical protein
MATHTGLQKDRLIALWVSNAPSIRARENDHLQVIALSGHNSGLNQNVAHVISVASSNLMPSQHTMVKKAQNRP